MVKQDEYWFDENGNLTPHTLISIDDLLDFETAFVVNFENSITRQIIFTGLLEYLGDMGLLLADLGYKGTWQVWLNGSFTTAKRNPNDVDVLFEPMFANNAATRYGVDAYFLFRDGSARSNELTNYWREQFGTDRNGRAKGIISLDILFG